MVDEGLKPKVSVLMPYYVRPTQLQNTLDSYRYWYGDIADDIEIILIDDGSPLHDPALSLLEDSGFVGKYQRIGRDQRGNPAHPFNLAAGMASGEILLLTNPENMHLGPIIKDVIEQMVWPSTYRCYACRSIKCAPFADVLANPDAYTRRDEVPHGYYQHSSHANRLIYFCAAIQREAYFRVEGIDEVYTGGYGWEDLDAIARWRRMGVRCEAIDSLEVGHQQHERFPDMQGYERNKRLFYDRFGRGEFIYTSDCGSVLR